MSEFNIIPTWDLSESDWLKIREGGIGGSDAGVICGVDKYNSPYKLWAEKTHTVERSFSGNEATQWGHDLEPVIGAAYARDYNKALVEWPVLIWSNDPDAPFMFANLDYVEVEPSEEFPAGEVTVWHNTTPPPSIIDIVECKTTGIATMGNAREWDNGQVPPKYLVQGYHYGLVVGTILPPLDHVTFVALVGGKGLVVRSLGKREGDDILWDDEVAENIKINEDQWWDLVRLEIPPDIDGSEATAAIIESYFPRSVKGKTLEASKELYDLLVEFQNVKKKQVSEAEKERDAYKNNIVKLIGDASEVVYTDPETGEKILIATFRSGEDKTTFDAKRLLEEQPDIYKKFLKTGPGARTLLPKV